VTAGAVAAVAATGVPPGDGGAAPAGVPVDAAVPNNAGCIWDDGKGEDEDAAKALIPTHSRRVWISVIVDSKG